MNGLGKPQRLLTQWLGLELGKPVFLSSVLGVCEAAGPARELAGWKYLSWVICTEDAEGMAGSELCTPICFGMESGLGQWGSGGGVRESSPPAEEGAGKHELAEDWRALEVLHILQ